MVVNVAFQDVGKEAEVAQLLLCDDDDDNNEETRPSTSAPSKNQRASTAFQSKKSRQGNSDDPDWRNSSQKRGKKQKIKSSIPTSTAAAAPVQPTPSVSVDTRHHALSKYSLKFLSHFCSINIKLLSPTFLFC